jgi:type IV secretory pathway protease TraF
MGRGVYVAVSKDRFERGELVVIKIPKVAMPWFPDKESLLKRITGVEGDLLCYSESKASVNDREFVLLRFDYKGERLPRQEVGCRRLVQNEFFVSGDSEDSFDSRYFGSISIDEIRRVVRPVWKIFTTEERREDSEIFSPQRTLRTQRGFWGGG